MSEEEKKAIEDLKNLKKGIEILNSICEITKAEKDEVDIKAIDIVLNLINKQQKEIAERDKYNITTLPFEELKEIIEQNKNISIFGKEYISKDKIREIIGKYIDIQEHKKYTNQELYGEDLKNMINELLEEER